MKLIIGKIFDQETNYCNFCEEKKKLCTTYINVSITKYETEYQSSFLGGIKEVVKGKNFFNFEKKKIGICKDCAKQISQQL